MYIGFVLYRNKAYFKKRNYISCKPKMSSNEVELAQAIIDDEKDTIATLLKDDNVKTWISNHVPLKSLHDHKLLGTVEWTTPLCRACALATLDTIKLLVEASASLYSVNSKGQSALAAVFSSKKDVLDKAKYVLSRDEKLLKETDNEQFTPLHTASQEGQVKQTICRMKNY